MKKYIKPHIEDLVYKADGISPVAAMASAFTAGVSLGKGLRSALGIEKVGVSSIGCLKEVLSNE